MYEIKHKLSKQRNNKYKIATLWEMNIEDLSFTKSVIHLYAGDDQFSLTEFIISYQTRRLIRL